MSDDERPSPGPWRLEAFNGSLRLVGLDGKPERGAPAETNPRLALDERVKGLIEGFEGAIERLSRKTRGDVLDEWRARAIGRARAEPLVRRAQEVIAFDARRQHEELRAAGWSIKEIAQLWATKDRAGVAEDSTAGDDMATDWESFREDLLNRTLHSQYKFKPEIHDHFKFDKKTKKKLLRNLPRKSLENNIG
jgi:hypothetical protein